jgi:hypothetical protein
MKAVFWGGGNGKYIKNYFALIKKKCRFKNLI